MFHEVTPRAMFEEVCLTFVPIKFNGSDCKMFSDHYVHKLYLDEDNLQTNVSAFAAKWDFALKGIRSEVSNKKQVFTKHLFNYTCRHIHIANKISPKFLVGVDQLLEHSSLCESFTDLVRSNRIVKKFSLILLNCLRIQTSSTDMLLKSGEWSILYNHMSATVHD